MAENKELIEIVKGMPDGAKAIQANFTTINEDRVSESELENFADKKELEKVSSNVDKLATETDDRFKLVNGQFANLLVCDVLWEGSVLTGKSLELKHNITDYDTIKYYCTVPVGGQIIEKETTKNNHNLNFIGLGGGNNSIRVVEVIFTNVDATHLNLKTFVEYKSVGDTVTDIKTSPIYKIEGIKKKKNPSLV